MKTLKEILAGNRLFFGLWLLFFAVGLFFLLSLGKAASFLDLNAYHHSTLDTIFIWVTFLGNGVFSVVVFVIFLLQRRRSQATQVMVAFLLSALVAQIRPWICQLSLRSHHLRLRPRDPPGHLHKKPKSQDRFPPQRHSRRLLTHLSWPAFPGRRTHRLLHRHAYRGPGSLALC